jgi:hypothetical protein
MAIKKGKVKKSGYNLTYFDHNEKLLLRTFRSESDESAKRMVKKFIASERKSHNANVRAVLLTKDILL